jgi:predicted DNA-binding transcriptional regulator
MEEIDLKEISLEKSSVRIRKIAESISPGKGINLHEVAAEMGIVPNSVRIHAKALGCYAVLTVKGKPVGFVTSLKQ